MELEHEFVVPVPRAQAWAVLMDVERVAPCMPGATFDGFEGDGFKGRVKIKLGPITVTYAGHARFVDTDEAAGRTVIEATGKESRGPGTASATIHALMTEEGENTRVKVVTDLNVTGKPAQFGRGVMAEVGAKLVGQFADCLSAQIQQGSVTAEPEQAADPVASSVADAPAPPALASVPPRPETGPESRPTADAIDLVDAAGLPVLKRVAPVVVVLFGAYVVWRLLRRSRR